MEIILNPWPWYVSGPLIALVLALLLLAGKKFGMSSNLRTLCAAAGAGKKIKFFDYDWKSHRWNLVVVLGVIIGAFIAKNFLSIDDSVAISPETIKSLSELGFENAGQHYLPNELFGLTSLKSLVILIIAGTLVGFGTRYAGGCTSGHAISGLSNLQIPSLIAVIGFFIGGLIMVHLIFPLIF